MRGKKGKTKTCWKPSQAPHLLFASTFQRTGPRWGVLHPHGPGVLPWLCAGRDDAAATSQVPQLDQHGGGGSTSLWCHRYALSWPGLPTQFSGSPFKIKLG